jgi:hypothetical protein
MVNISIRGLYFTCESGPGLKIDDIADFIFKFQREDSNPLVPKEIRAKCQVRRVEPPTEEFPDFGVAVEFISGPVFIYGD